MKRFPQILTLAILFTTMVTAPGCSKDKTPGGGNALNIFYPTTVSFYDGNNSAYPTVWKYEYDADHNLTKYGKEEDAYRDVSRNGANSFVYNYTFNNVQMTSYAFLLANSQTGVSIYDGSPTEVSIDRFTKNLTSGVSNSEHVANHFFAVNVDGLILKEILPEANARNYNYNYDETKNLKLVEYTENGAVYTRIKVSGLLENPSPFVAVKGYKWASYPQVSSADISFAFFNRCPTQFIVESWKASNNTWEVYEQDDFSYVFDENGYPTQVTAKTTYYPNGNSSVFTRVFNFTYARL